jgi:hypothetical protein
MTFPVDELANAATPREARDGLKALLSYELLGPEQPDEVLDESPLTRYLTGMLAPFGTGVAVEEQDDSLTAEEGDEELGAPDHASPLSQAITPSSIGLSFLLPAGTTAVEVAAEWGEYAPENVPPEENSEPSSKEVEHGDEPPDAAPTAKNTGDQADEEGRKRSRPRRIWPRTAKAPNPRGIELRPGEGLISEPLEGADGVTIEHLARELDDRLAVSVFLVNRRVHEKQRRPPVESWLFQPAVTVRAEDGSGLFLPREIEPSLVSSDSDTESNRLLFRHRREFAIGHGCGAEWVLSDKDDQRATDVKTSLIPSYELPRVDPRDLGNPVLGMAELAAVESGDALRAALEPLLDAYEAWIHGKRSELDDLPVDLRSIGAGHLDDCETALRRMQAGLDLIASDAGTLRAFRFANEAMALQRAHTVWATARRDDPGTAPSEPTTEGRWRPFQIAFILLNAPALIDDSHADRDVGDLLWFPTGGGKTEAYLGLAAFCMALRRLRAVPGARTDAGVAVLMRYTLRLLTIQQFQRAAALICACEVLREREPDIWGTRRFSIGVWLGLAATPNRHADSRRALDRLAKGETQDEANPCQLEACPWCGEGLTHDDYWSDASAIRTRVACRRRGCEFSRDLRSDGLPVVLVDEEIYRECPGLVIATVDKFAQMPWRGEVGALFGLVDRECSRCGFLSPDTDHSEAHRARRGVAATEQSVLETERLAPPNLIIQDELHLISGPLGTLMGLYETAVDHLATRVEDGRVVRPKVIASTATVRRAYEQVQAVFDRRLSVFPPPGLEPEDSFFAVERPVSEESPGRLYVGVAGQGKSMKTALIRVASALLSASAGLRDANPALAEPYLTLVSYFNSLRELGGAVRLVEDDIPARLRQLERRDLPHRGRPVYVELTSRVPSDQIPARLQRLAQRHDAPRTEDQPLPLDVVLASSMLSVGVDVGRLGLMTVLGQPKTTAEYIQATSRVGRESWGPGLVVTIYNWSRPRDLSHYERFRQYHSTLYRGVEAVSATPFSSRARDRALRPTFTALARLSQEDWMPELAASRFDPTRAAVAGMSREFRRRAEAIAGQAVAEEVEQALKGVGDEWGEYAQHALRYGWRSPDPENQPEEDVLLQRAGEPGVGHWPAPESLREVEEHSLIYVLGLDGG